MKIKFIILSLLMMGSVWAAGGSKGAKEAKFTKSSSAPTSPKSSKFTKPESVAAPKHEMNPEVAEQLKKQPKKSAMKQKPVDPNSMSDEEFERYLKARAERKAAGIEEPTAARKKGVTWGEDEVREIERVKGAKPVPEKADLTQAQIAQKTAVKGVLTSDETVTPAMVKIEIQEGDKMVKVEVPAWQAQGIQKMKDEIARTEKEIAAEEAAE